MRARRQLPASRRLCWCMVVETDNFAKDAARAGPRPSDAVEIWLRRGFKDRYEAALAEPVPAELVLLATRLCH